MEVCQVFFHKVANGGQGAVTQFVGYRKPSLGKVERVSTVDELGKPYFADPSA
jgi:hypothetical protein